MKKAFHKFLEHVQTNPLIYNTLHFDPYSRFSICSNIFRFSANNLKKNSNSEKTTTFHKFVEHVETNQLTYKILHFDQYSRLAIRFNIFFFCF